MRKIIHRTLNTRSQMISILNTFTREEMELVMDHIEYIIKETVTNITGELSNDNKELLINDRRAEPCGIVDLHVLF